MKYIKIFRFLIITILSLITFSQCIKAQKSNKTEMKKLAFKNMVDSQNFIFEAEKYGIAFKVLELGEGVEVC